MASPAFNKVDQITMTVGRSRINVVGQHQRVIDALSCVSNAVQWRHQASG